MKRYFLPSIRGSRFILALAAAVLTGFAEPARADFTGLYADTPAPSSYYDPSGPLGGMFGTWALSGNDYHFFAFTIDADPSEVTFNTGYAEDDGGSDQFSMMFTHTAAASGSLSFDYDLTVANLVNDSAAYTINGVYTFLAPGTGSVSGVMLNAGDVFSFYVVAGSASKAHPNVANSATDLTVTDFVAPVPEPSSAGWLGWTAGLGLAGVAWRWLAKHGGPLVFPG